MKLNRLVVLLFASIFALSSVNSMAIVKKQTASKPAAAKTTKKSTTKTSTNHSKTHYGVKGHKLQPTKVSSMTYSYREKGKTHKTISKEASRNYSQTGIASYYGGMFNGRKTANGEIFNENLYTAAHKTLALGSYALVTNLRNNKKVIVKINDRGPFSKARIIDLSKGAAREIGMIHSGVAQVRVEALHVDSRGYISGKGAESLYRLAKKEGLPLKLKEGSSTLAFKADEGVKSKKADSNLKKGKNHSAPVEKLSGSKVIVTTKTLKEAKKIALQVKQKAVVEPSGSNYRVLIKVANKVEGDKVQKQVKKLAHYQSIHYSSK